MFTKLQTINHKPKPYEVYTAEELWTNEHTAQQMLMYHLNEHVDAASRKIEFIDRSVDWICSTFNIGAGSAVADFGCGPGLYASRLAKKGAAVTGIDFSGNSLNYARGEAEKAGLSINYIQSNYLDFETDQHFDLIIMIMCDYCVLSPDQRKKLLDRFAKLLKPEGRVLLDVNSLVRYDAKEESAIYELNQLGGFWSSEDYYCFVNTFKYDEEKLILDKYTVIEAGGAEKEIYNWYKCYDKEMLTHEFAENGFEIEKFYSDVTGNTYDPEAEEIAVVLKGSRNE